MTWSERKGKHRDWSVPLDAPSRGGHLHPYYGYKMAPAHKAGGKRKRILIPAAPARTPNRGDK